MTVREKAWLFLSFTLQVFALSIEDASAGVGLVVWLCGIVAGFVFIVCEEWSGDAD